MGFWGIDVKPGKPHPYHSDNVEGTLCVTQATLGLGKSTDRSILQCSVGHNSPIFLCSLLPDKTESCPLELEFKDELVAFSVVGKRSIHLSGYFVADEGDYLPDEYDPDSGEDIGDAESDDESSEFEFDDDDEFINGRDDDDFNVFRSSPIPNSGVVIEEIEDDEQPTNGDGLSKLKKKKNGSGGVSVPESKDEDGFPVSATEEGGKAIIQRPYPKESKKKKRKVKETTEADSQPEKKKKKKKKQKQKGNEVTVADTVEDGKKELSGDETQLADSKQGPPDTNEGDKRETEVDEGSAPSKSASKKKKKNKKAGGDGESTVEKVVPGVTSDGASDEKKSASKSSNVRTFSNGLVIEDVAMGKPAAKRAYPGSQVSVCYTGKLKQNGKIFDSNEGRAPFKFRLGVGQVIKGWDVGVNGMRVGDKRRLMIPPTMGYGQQGAGSKIPPNSWLVFDVELMNVG